MIGEYIINNALHEPFAGLLNGIVFGTKATLSDELYTALVQTGTIHIIALSGFNITILASLVNSTLVSVIGRKASSVATIILIIGFVWLVGPSPTIVRAALMGIISLVAVIYGRSYWAFFTLLLTSGIMLIIRPSWIGDISFQLSVSATLGIILFGSCAPKTRNNTYGSRMHDIVARWEVAHWYEKVYYSIVRMGLFVKTRIDEDLRITLAAQVFTTPIILYYFHRVSIISPVTNVLIGWAIPPVTVAGILTVVFGLFWQPLSYVPAWFAWVFLKYLIFVVDIFSSIPFASIGT